MHPYHQRVFKDDRKQHYPQCDIPSFQVPPMPRGDGMHRRMLRWARILALLALLVANPLSAQTLRIFNIDVEQADRGSAGHA